MPSPFVPLLGDTLLRSNCEAVRTADALAGKTVGLYFSAHWCPPCVPELSGHCAQRRTAALPARARSVGRR